MGWWPWTRWRRTWRLQQLEFSSNGRKPSLVDAILDSSAWTGRLSNTDATYPIDRSYQAMTRP